MADEVIGIHQVNNAIIRNNSCSGIKAGIWVLHSQHFLIDGNYVERIPSAPMPAWGLGATWWAGSLLFCGLELDAAVPPCTDGRITNNQFIISPLAGSPPPGTAPGLPAPQTAPTVTAVPGPAGTNLPPGTYHARITFAPPPPPPPPASPPYLESAPSSEASLPIPSPAEVLQIGLPPAPTWVSTNPYATGDLVSYNGACYACYLATSTGNEPGPASAVWGPVGSVNIYLGLAAGQEQFQASVPAGTTTWTEPTSGLVPGQPPPAGVHGFVQLGGLRRALVTGNLCRCDTPYVAVPAFYIEPYPPPGGEFGWSDSEGMDTDQIARPRDILIQANRATGAAVNLDPALVGGVANGIVPGGVAAQPPYQQPATVFQMGEYQWPPATPVAPAWIPGPITWQGNEANSFTAFGQNSSFSISNRIIGGSGDGLQNVDGYLVPDAIMLWSGTAATVSGQTVPAANGGGSSFFPLRSGIIFAIKVTIADPIAAASTILVELAKNGTANPADSLETGSDTPYAKGRYYGLSTPGANNRFTPTDYLQINLTLTAQNTPQELSTLVELYGMYTGNNSKPGA